MPMSMSDDEIYVQHMPNYNLNRNLCIAYYQRPTSREKKAMPDVVLICSVGFCTFSCFSRPGSCQMYQMLNDTPTTKSTLRRHSVCCAIRHC